jgi:prepilin peptidase CpaA
MLWPGGVFAALVVVLLTLAACADIATRTIPDAIAIALTLIGMAARLFIGPSAVLVSVAVALTLFLLLVLLHARGMIGGGDVKLAAALCFGLSLHGTQRFIVVTVIAGGVLALFHLAARWALRNLPLHAPPPRGTNSLRRIFVVERWRIARHGPLPYGVAIACGGIWTVLSGPGN